MSAALVGSLNAGGLNPLSLSVLGLAGAQLQANLTGALSLQAQASLGAPPLTAQLQSLLEAVAALEAGIALGLPGVTFSVSAAAAVVADAQAKLGGLGALLALLGGPSMFVYAYAGGTVATLGADLSAAIVAEPPPGLVGSSQVAGLLIGAGATVWATAISPYFGGL
jgi:hypothetical protein